MFLIDSANLKTIKTLNETYTFSGITTNPSLMAKERRTDFLHHLKELRNAMPKATLYVQVNAEEKEEMLEEIKAFKSVLNPPFMIKVPATKAGFALMKEEVDVEVAMTGISDFFQALEAIASGAKTLIIYVSRMLQNGHDPYQLIKDIRQVIEMQNLEVRLIGASFKSKSEIKQAMLSGLDQVTIKPTLLETLFLNPLTETSVKQFSKEFNARYQKRFIKS